LLDIDLGIADVPMLVGKVGHDCVLDLLMATGRLRCEEDDERLVDDDKFCNIPSIEGSRYEGA
jgi:hypothetical protein